MVERQLPNARRVKEHRYSCGVPPHGTDVATKAPLESRSLQPSHFPRHFGHKKLLWLAAIDQLRSLWRGTKFLYEKEKAAFAKRLELALRRSGESIEGSTQLALQFNLRHKAGDPVTTQTAQKWLTGQTIPSKEKLATLAK